MKEINSTLQLLEELNIIKGNSIYTEKEFSEEKENLKEMEQIYLRLDKVLHELRYVSDKNEDLAVEQLIQLHLIYSDFVWHYDQIHNMIKKMIKMYR